MIISVNKDGNIGNVQDQFNAYFPFLKIEFYGLHDTVENKPGVKPFLNPRFKLNDSTMSLHMADIMLSDEMTVAELESKLYEAFGLYAEVLRKSGNIWLETTLTSGWTLLRQNIMGERIS